MEAVDHVGEAVPAGGGGGVEPGAVVGDLEGELPAACCSLIMLCEAWAYLTTFWMASSTQK
ncbi:MAG: hypothetical protein M3O70_21300 [Actinomycetota bacterium]|nr:hypothetical protein [Actinomycetota bacterium]